MPMRVALHCPWNRVFCLSIPSGFWHFSVLKSTVGIPGMKLQEPVHPLFQPPVSPMNRTVSVATVFQKLPAIPPQFTEKTITLLRIMRYNLVINEI
jgi:hypothetical protein